MKTKDNNEAHLKKVGFFVVGGLAKTEMYT
jgi:hypothetical protein